MAQRLWVIDHAIAYVDNGRVTLQIDKPTRHLPRREAFAVADKIWFANQMRQLEIARQRRETKEIPLTDRRRRSSLRLGGGFMITQGTKLVVVRRHLDAPRPGQLCECGGVFELLEPDSEEEKKPEEEKPEEKESEDVLNDYIVSLLKESQEIVIIRGRTLYIPQLAPSPGRQIGFQPPGTLDAYNKIIEKEVISEVEKAEIPVDPSNFRRFWMKILDYERAVRLEFAYSPQLYVEITAEVDSSSLECVGVLSFPEDIDTAVIAYLEEKRLDLEKRAKSEANDTEKAKLEEEIKKLKEEIKRALKEKKEGEEGEKFQYWDTELKWDHERQEEGGPVDRDVYLIDTKQGDVTVWSMVPDDEERKREPGEPTNIWTELSATKLGPAGTGGRYATEKLEKAIKMHCPYANLQPLVTH